jgi:hypothetical protein
MNQKDVPHLQDLLQYDVHTQTDGNFFVLVGFSIMSVPLKQSCQNKMSYPQSILFVTMKIC